MNSIKNLAKWADLLILFHIGKEPCFTVVAILPFPYFHASLRTPRKLLESQGSSYLIFLNSKYRLSLFPKTD